MEALFEPFNNAFNNGVVVGWEGGRGASEPTDQAWPTRYDPVWATVLIESESMEPREASRQEYELLSETGIAVERVLIQPAGSPVPSVDRDEGVRTIFDQEAARMANDHEPSDFIEWFQGLRNRVLAACR